MSKQLFYLRIWSVCGWMVVLANSTGSLLARENCDTCGKVIEGTIYTWEDKIANVKKRLCSTCTDLPSVCYLCGVPVLRDFQSLADGRTLCNRDASTAVLDDELAVRFCEEAKQALDRQFIRFINFPDTNVTLSLMDRVHIQEIYKFAGHDYLCPNMWGCTVTRTNKGGHHFDLSLLSGLPKELLQATCVHEHTHTWIRQNLSAARNALIDKDAIEGFCELVSYLYVEAQGLSAARDHILSNHYTRGQVHLFIEAEQRFGFNDVVDWMRYGDDSRLFTNEVLRIRDLHLPARVNRPPRPVFVAAGVPPRRFQQLVLQGITWSRTRPMAMINGRNVEPGDEVKVSMGDTNVTLHCLSIAEKSVAVRVAGDTESRVLQLPEH